MKASSGGECFQTAVEADSQPGTVAKDHQAIYLKQAEMMVCG